MNLDIAHNELPPQEEEYINDHKDEEYIEDQEEVEGEDDYFIDEEEIFEQM